MNISILHISDLHRDPDNPIRNDVLLDSLENDRRHYSAEEIPSVRPPDLIIVSGDIVQGVGPDTFDPEARLREQYREALDFLAQLADRFLAGNRNHVVLVPGNHDVSTYHFKRSLRLIDILPDRKKELVTQLFSPDSTLRWSWASFELYEIADKAVYAQRLAAFADFYTEFYSGTRTYDLDPANQIDIFDFPEFDMTIAGFSSCYQNDLFNPQGAIHPGCIARAGEKLRDLRLQNRLRIAVWHHNIEGIPAHSDYMNPDLVQNLIDRGISLGFHGHQHWPQFLDTRFRHGIDRKIAVVSAGTLCGAASFKYRRAYSVIELDTASRYGRLHVRSMLNDNLGLPIWGRYVLPPNASPYYEFEYAQPPEPVVNSSLSIKSLIEAQYLYNSGDFQKAADVLIPIAASDSLAKPLLLDCLLKSRNYNALITYFDPPASEVEAIHLMDALWETGRHDRLTQVLKTPIVAETSDASTIEIRKKYAARLSK